MSDNIYVNRIGQGNSIPKHLKVCVKRRYQQLIEDQNNLTSFGDITEKLINDYSICEKSVYNIINSEAISPKKRKRGCHYTYNNEDCDIIDDIICDLNDQNKNPSKYDVYKYIQSAPDCGLSFVGCSLPVFNKLMDEMGYEYCDRHKIIRSQIVNSDRIQNKIRQFLIDKQKLLKQSPNKPEFVYLDETYKHINDGNNKVLQPINVNKQRSLGNICGKGDRFSVIHAINIDGFIPNCELILKNTDINANRFEEWAETQLIPNLPKNSIVIYDNASIHSRQYEYSRTPTQSSTKLYMQNWLTAHDIEFDPNFNRKELLELIKKHPQPKQYYFDEMLKANGHFGLRLPQYCCDLNPIEMIWGTWKGIIDKNSFKHKPSEYKDFLSNCFNKISSSVIARTIRKTTRTVEAPYLKKFNLVHMPVIDHHNYFLNFDSINCDSESDSDCDN